MLASTSWLEEHEYSRPLLGKYVESGWLESPARGVYRRLGPPLKWQHVVASLLLLQESYFHVGRTALVQRGLGHYVQMGGTQPILLYGPEVLPSWVNKLAARSRAIDDVRSHERGAAFGRGQMGILDRRS